MKNLRKTCLAAVVAMGLFVTAVPVQAVYAADASFVYNEKTGNPAGGENTVTVTLPQDAATRLPGHQNVGLNVGIAWKLGEKSFVDGSTYADLNEQAETVNLEEEVFTLSDLEKINSNTLRLEDKAQPDFNGVDKLYKKSEKLKKEKLPLNLQAYFTMAPVIAKSLYSDTDINGCVVLPFFGEQCVNCGPLRKIVNPNGAIVNGVDKAEEVKDKYFTPAETADRFHLVEFQDEDCNVTYVDLVARLSDDVDTSALTDGKLNIEFKGYNFQPKWVFGVEDTKENPVTSENYGKLDLEKLLDVPATEDFAVKMAIPAKEYKTFVFRCVLRHARLAAAADFTGDMTLGVTEVTSKELSFKNKPVKDGAAKSVISGFIRGNMCADNFSDGLNEPARAEINKRLQAKGSTYQLQKNTLISALANQIVYVAPEKQIEEEEPTQPDPTPWDTPDEGIVVVEKEKKDEVPNTAASTGAAASIALVSLAGLAILLKKK